MKLREWFSCLVWIAATNLFLFAIYPEAFPWLGVILGIPSGWLGGTLYGKYFDV
jgi:hypothetical protein